VIVHAGELVPRSYIGSSWQGKPVARGIMFLDSKSSKWDRFGSRIEGGLYYMCLMGARCFKKENCSGCYQGTSSQKSGCGIGSPIPCIYQSGSGYNRGTD